MNQDEMASDEEVKDREADIKLLVDKIICFENQALKGYLDDDNTEDFDFFITDDAKSVRYTEEIREQKPKDCISFIADIVADSPWWPYDAREARKLLMEIRNACNLPIYDDAQYAGVIENLSVAEKKDKILHAMVSEGFIEKHLTDSDPYFMYILIQQHPLSDGFIKRHEKEIPWKRIQSDLESGKSFDFLPKDILEKNLSTSQTKSVR